MLQFTLWNACRVRHALRVGLCIRRDFIWSDIMANVNVTKEWCCVLQAALIIDDKDR